MYWAVSALDLAASARSANFPSVYVAGRAATDLAGAMFGPLVLVNGRRRASQFLQTLG